MIAVNEDERIEKRIIMEKELRIIISGGVTGLYYTADFKVYL